MEHDPFITLPKPWTPQFSKSRRLVYYYNPFTQESVWEPPKGSIIGGVVINNSEVTSRDGQPKETKRSQTNADELAVPVDVLAAPPSVDSRVANLQTRDDSGGSSPRSTATTTLDSHARQHGGSVDAGSETVTSSITRRRKLDKQSSKKVSKNASSVVATKSHTTLSEKKREATPAASRLARLQNLLSEIQNKKKLGNTLSSNSTSTSPSNTQSCSVNAGRKRCEGESEALGKRRRLGEVSDVDSNLAGETRSDALPGCIVTSTTVSSSVCRDRDSVSSCGTYGPLSPKPGEKLPYLDTDTDNTRSPSPPSKVVASALPLPRAEQAASHRKEDPRNDTFRTKKTFTVDKLPRLVQHAYDDNQNNVTCKTEERPMLHATRKLFSHEHGVNCMPSVKVSVQSRLSKGSSDTDNSVKKACRTEGAARLSTNSHSRDLTNRISTPNSSNISSQSRFSTTPSGSCKRSLSSDSGKGLSVPPKKRPSNEAVSVNKSSNTRVSVQSRLEACVSIRASITSTPSTRVSRTRVVSPETGEATDRSSQPCTAHPSDINLPAITKFRERIAVLPPDKVLESTKHVQSPSVCKLSTSCTQPKLKDDKLSKCNRLGSVWEPSVEPCPVADATLHAEEETMEVDVPVLPETLIQSSNKHLFNDAESIVSFSSEMPATTLKCNDELNTWLNQCEPPSPTGNHDFFLAEELSDYEDSDEAMEWDDVDDDLSQVVSVMPTKSAKADEWFIVVDTNILLHSVSIVEELRDTPFPHLGLPVLIIPWLVLQELDGLKAQRSQHKSKDLALVSKARRAVQFLNSNLKKCHPRVRGQTALESEVEHYKREGADDGILQCCLQLKEKNNLAVILTNDKNLANKAIVSGISSFTNDEIVAKLYEMGVQLQSSNTKKQGRETAVASLLTSDQTDLEKTKVDLVFCHLKLLLKDILTEALTSGMKKVYGHIWQSRTIKKPPWTLSDVLYCILKHWTVMKEHEFRQNTWPSRDDKLMSSATDMKKLLTMLQAFLKAVSQHCFDYSLSDVKDVINCSIDVCIGMTAVSFREKLSETIYKLEVMKKNVDSI